MPDILITGVTVTSSVKKARSLFWGKNSVAIETEINSAGGKLPVPALGEKLVIALEPFLSASSQVSGSAENRRGAEQAGFGPGGERLFFASGDIVSSPDAGVLRSGIAAARKAGASERLWYAITTGFERSDGKSIWYRVQQQAASDLRPYLSRLSARLFMRMLPVVVDQLQIGFDLFGTKIQSSLFGSGPVVVGKVRIDLTPSACRVIIEEQFPRGESGVPLAGHQVPQLIDRAFAGARVLKGFASYLAVSLTGTSGESTPGQ